MGETVPEKSSPEWSFEGEIVGLLELAAAQIEIAVRESDTPIAELSAVVEALAAQAGRLELEAEQLRRALPARSESLAEEALRLRRQLQRATVALQFHDRLTQRLANARQALKTLASAVDARQQHESADAWHTLRDRLRSQCSMEHERLMFDLLINGASPEEVLAALGEMGPVGAAGNVDLF
jgi:hypothetical protein